MPAGYSVITGDPNLAFSKADAELFTTRFSARTWEYVEHPKAFSG